MLWEATITKRRNTWNVVFYAFTKKDASLIHPNFYLSFRYDNATWAAYPLHQGEKKVLLFPPHFLERYTERYLNKLGGNDIPYTFKDVIDVFFCKNYHFSVQRPLSDEFSLRGFCEDGILLGDWLSDSIGLVKTFLSRKELKPNQYAEYFDAVLSWMISDMFFAKNGCMMSDEDFDTFPDTYWGPET